MYRVKVDEFLEEILSFIKFPFGKQDIKDELESHILDKIDYYTQKGYEDKESESLAIKDMGDSKEIGVELNKQHNPFFGWFLIVSNTFIVLFITIIAFNFAINLSMNLFSGNTARSIPKEDIVYRVSANKKVRIDDRIIEFTDLVYEKDGDMNIFFTDYETGFYGKVWGVSTIGNVSDDLGNKYLGYSASGSGSGKTKSMLTIREFSDKASTLIIDYDGFNRKYHVEIPLEGGDRDEPK